MVTPCFSLPTALRASIVASVSLKMEKRAIVSCSELYGVPPRCWRMKRSNCGNCGSEAMSEVEESEKPMRESIFCMVCAMHGRQKAVSHLEVRPSTQGWIIWWARCVPAAGCIDERGRACERDGDADRQLGSDIVSELRDLAAAAIAANFSSPPRRAKWPTHLSRRPARPSSRGRLLQRRRLRAVAEVVSEFKEAKEDRLTEELYTHGTRAAAATGCLGWCARA